MENLNHIFNCYSDEEYCDWYFYGIEGKDSFSSDFDEEYCLTYISNLKKVILMDFKRILDYKIVYCNYHDELSSEIENLLDTYFNEFYDSKNFITLTDSYLCFNNMEDIACLECYLKYDYKTIVIVSRNYQTFYFIKNRKNVITDREKTMIKIFSICNGKIEGRTVLVEGGIDFFFFPTVDFYDIDQVVDQIHFQFQKK